MRGSVAKAEPDGYTLLMASAAQVTIPPWINRSLSFDPPRDLVPVAHLADTPMVLIVSASSKAQTVSDFVALAKANRGGLNYGSTGVGTISNLVMDQSYSRVRPILPEIALSFLLIFWAIVMARRAVDAANK